MSAERAAELLARLRAADPARRDAILTTLGGADPRLRTTFERLLEDDSTSSLLVTGGGLAGASGLDLLAELAPLPATVGDTVGAVELVGILGEGGMGTVFEGYDTKLERRVAVKTVRTDRRAGEAARSRFRREARILSKLDHPAICEVYDLVERPEADYLILELVEGETLREHLRRADVVPSRRLELARDLAAALAAAHAKDIVHRDLKPDNIMVRPDGAIKILDFGIARVAGVVAPEPSPTAGASPDLRFAETGAASDAISGDPAKATLLTQLGSILGTIAYMSPEQARGEEVTTASDVYSLGLIFQELFGGPPGHPTLPAEDLLERAREARLEPPTGVAPEISRLLATLLAFEPSSRPTATRVAAVLARLAERPRRRRFALATTSTAIVAAIAVWFGLQTHATRQVCAAAAAPAESAWSPAVRTALQHAFDGLEISGAAQVGARVADRLDHYVGDWAAMRTETCRATHVSSVQSEELMDRRMACLDHALGRFRAIVSVLGSIDRETLEKAVQTSDTLPPLALCADAELMLAPVAPPATTAGVTALSALEDRLALGTALLDAGRLRQAEESILGIEEQAAALGYRPAEARTYYLRGRLQRVRGEFQDAARRLEQALVAAFAGGDEEWQARSLAELVFVTGSDLADIASAERWQNLGFALLERIGDDSPIAADLYHAVGTVRMWDDLVLARSLLERAEAIRRRTLGESHIDSIRSRVNLANVYFLTGEFREAERHSQLAAEIASSSLGAEHVYRATALGNVGAAREQLGDLAGARDAYSLARQLHVTSKGKASFDVAILDVNLANLDLKSQRYAAARDRARGALEIFEKALPAQHPYFAYPRFTIGAALLGLMDIDAAIPELEKAVVLFERQHLLPTELAEARFALARALWAAGAKSSRARSLAIAAANDLEEVAWAATLRREIEAWLRRHGVRSEGGEGASGGPSSSPGERDLEDAGGVGLATASAGGVPTTTQLAR